MAIAFSVQEKICVIFGAVFMNLRNNMTPLIILRLFVLGMLVLGLTSCKENRNTEENKEEAPTAAAKQSEDAKLKVPAEYRYIVKIGDQAPTFTADIATGGQVTPADLKGKVTMLQFTASWCKVCWKEMPHIEKDIWQKYKDRKDFMLLGIDRDEERDKVIRFGQDVNVTYPLVLDPGSKIFHLFAEEGAGITRNVIIDRTGKIVFMTRLFKEEEFEAMKDVIDGLMR